jgi:hypothetical protein
MSDCCNENGCEQGDFRDTVVSSLATIKESQHSVIERLDKLNGSVGRHESRISDIEKFNAGTAGGNKISAKYLKYLWAAVGGVLLFAAEHFSQLVAPFLK